MMYTKKNDNNYKNSLLKKKGRPRNSNNKRPVHDKFSKDNIKRKIQVYYIKFLGDLLNNIIKKY